MALQNFEGGDRVRITLKDGSSREGVYLPNEETDHLVIKLDSGYNIGIASENVQSMEVVEKNKETKTKEEPTIEKNQDLPTIALIHTGGTIASKIDYKTGGVISRFSDREILEMFPELKEFVNIESELIFNKFSEDMNFSDHQKIAEACKKHIDNGVEGVIVTHGTDTMHYSAASLSFMFEELPVPIVLVGAQRSSDRGSSDSKMNLLCAASFIAKSDYAGVGICMHETTDDEKCIVIPGVKARKMHTSRRDAFKTINGKPIAKVSYPSLALEMVQKSYPRKNEEQTVLKPKMDTSVGLLKVHPNIDPKIIDAFSGYHGLVVEGTGLGQIPSQGENNPVFEAVKRLGQEGTLIAMTSQCINGRVHSHVYSTAIELKEAGTVYCEDMLSETALVKIAWLLGNHPKNAKELLAKNLRGEISERSEYGEY